VTSDLVDTVDCSGYLHHVFRHTVKVVQICSEMIETVDFPRPDSAASLNQQKVKLNDAQRVRDTTLHHQIREDDVSQVRRASVPATFVCRLLTVRCIAVRSKVR